MQNKKWRKQAAENFLKASELDPNDVDHIGMLAAIYQAEGMITRADSLRKRAHSIDPAYVLPELGDGTEVTVD